MHDRSKAVTPSRTLQSIKERIDSLDAPAEMRTSVAHHIGHLQQLTEKLQKFGMDDSAIDHHVLDLFSRYEERLLHVMAACPPKSLV